MTAKVLDRGDPLPPSSGLIAAQPTLLPPAAAVCQAVRAAVCTTVCKHACSSGPCACTAAARWTAKAAVATIKCTHGADVWARAAPGLLLRAGQGAVTLRVQSVEAGGCQLAAEVLTSGTLLTGQAVAAVHPAEAEGAEGPPATASCPLLQLDAAQEQALHLLGAHEVTRPDFVAVPLQTGADARAVRQALDSAGGCLSFSALCRPVLQRLRQLMPSRNRACVQHVQRVAHSRACSLSVPCGQCCGRAGLNRPLFAARLSLRHPAAAGLERTQVLAKLESAVAIRNAEAILEEVAGLQVRGRRQCNRTWQLIIISHALMWHVVQGVPS